MSHRWMPAILLALIFWVSTGCAKQDAVEHPAGVEGPPPVGKAGEPAPEEPPLDGGMDPGTGTTTEEIGRGNVRLEQPPEGAKLTRNPIRIAGTARTFENNVSIRVRDAEGQVLEETNATARGELGNFNPWSADVYLTRLTGHEIVVEAFELSARDGSVDSLVRRRVPAEFEPRAIRLFFPNTSRSPNDCSVVYPVSRTVPSSLAIAHLIVEALIDGPTPEQQSDGYSSPFPRGTRVDAVNLRNGVLTVDFGPEMQNIGGSCKAQAIRASLETSLEKLPTIERVVIRAGGSEELALQP